jgi:hypothetical protein
VCKATLREDYTSGTMSKTGSFDEDLNVLREHRGEGTLRRTRRRRENRTNSNAE